MVKPSLITNEGTTPYTTVPRGLDKATYNQTIVFFEKILKLVHPFMPFITEEIWHELAERSEKDCLIVAQYVKPVPFDAEFLRNSEKVMELISQIRNFRSSRGMSPKEALKLSAKAIQKDDFRVYLLQFESIIKKLGNISDVEFTENPIGMSAFVVGSYEFFIPMEGKIDVAKEKEEINKEIDYLKGFLKSVDVKLNNERFVCNAKPEVIENERKKKADAEVKITALEKALLLL